MKHRSAIERLAKELERKGYNFLKEIEYYDGNRTAGEIDVLAEKDGIVEIYEIKTNPEDIRHGIEQLLRIEKYLGSMEKYVVCNEVYYHI